MKCSTCSVIYHGTCQNLRGNEIDYLNQSSEEWSCSICTAKIKCDDKRALRPRIGSLSSKTDTLLSSPVIDNLTPTTSDSHTLSTILAAISNIQANMITKGDMHDQLASLQKEMITMTEFRNEVSSLQEAIQACHQKLDTNAELLNLHSESIAQLQLQMASISEENKLLKKELDSLRSKLSQANIEGLVQEARDRIRRENNVIIYGLPDNNDDASTVNQLLNIVSPGFPTISSNNILRIGSTRNGQPRPLKVHTPSQQYVLQLLRNKNLIKAHQNFRNVSLQSDLTPTQLGQLRQLRSELQSRTDSGEPDLTIKYVKGVPTIIKKFTKN